MMGDSIEETRQYHVTYLRAISSPLRRQILRAERTATRPPRILGLEPS